MFYRCYYEQRLPCKLFPRSQLSFQIYLQKLIDRSRKKESTNSIYQTEYYFLIEKKENEIDYMAGTPF